MAPQLPDDVMITLLLRITRMSITVITAQITTSAFMLQATTPPGEGHN